MLASLQVRLSPPTLVSNLTNSLMQARRWRLGIFGWEKVWFKSLTPGRETFRIDGKPGNLEMNPSQER